MYINDDIFSNVSGTDNNCKLLNIEIKCSDLL